MKRALGIGIVGLLLLAATPVANAATTQELTITTASAKPAHGFLKFDTALDAFDFNGDGRKEIVGHNENRHVYVFDSRDGRILADLNTQYPSNWGARPINPPEVAIMEYQKAPHVIVANSAASIASFRYDGQADGKLQFTKVWERRMTECFGDPGMDAQPVVYDLDGDGKMEILVQTEEVGIYALRSDGSTMWKLCVGGGNGEPAVADIDGDGVPDVVFANDAGEVRRVNGRGGWIMWTFYGGATEYGLGVASMPVGPTIGQIDGKGGLDVAVGARDSSDHKDPHSNRAMLFAINGDSGKALWARAHPSGAPLTYTHPIIHDVDKDGEMDVLWADWNTVGHKPPFCDPRTDAGCDSTAWPWQPSGTPAIYRYDSTGDLRYRKTIGSYWSNNDLALADVDGDGIQEIIADNGASMIYIDSRTGATEATIGLNGWLPTRGPTVYDMHGDGSMQWIMPVHKGSEGGIMMFDTHVPYNAAWPHVPNYNAAAPSGTPPPAGTFQASFTVPDSTNNWWVEVFVSSNAPVTSVSAVINGGPVQLTKQSWGAWARSVYVPDGSEVVFKARDAQGREATSGKYVWGKAGSPPPPSGFDAKFTVPDTKNNWWVETKVEANAPVSGVTASVNGGSPVALAKTDWGTWAKSFYVPDGASVVFKATSSGGATATSSPYTWGSGGSSGGTFSASFAVPDSKNNWWVEVKVTANQPLSGVTASVNGGSPVALAKTDWGTWAKSFYVPDGASVVFKATSTTGGTATSSPFTWGKATSGAFTATFKVADTKNTWWVETQVTANQPVAKVTATVNGGTPVVLSKTDWGTWAKSFHVAPGSKVVFTATSSGGETATSTPYTWG